MEEGRIAIFIVDNSVQKGKESSQFFGSMIILDIVHTSKLNVNAIYTFVYIILLSMVIAIFFAILVATVKASKPMIAIQSTRETYFNYLPLTQCQPNGINITDGSIQYEMLDP